MNIRRGVATGPARSTPGIPPVSRSSPVRLTARPSVPAGLIRGSPTRSRSDRGCARQTESTRVWRQARNRGAIRGSHGLRPGRTETARHACQLPRALAPGMTITSPLRLGSLPHTIAREPGHRIDRRRDPLHPGRLELGRSGSSTPSVVLLRCWPAASLWRRWGGLLQPTRAARRIPDYAQPASWCHGRTSSERGPAPATHHPRHRRRCPVSPSTTSP